MSRSLWLSNVTGQRRRGTSFDELRDLLAFNITAHSIFEPLHCCLTDSPADQVAAEMKQLKFDVAGVRATQGGRLLGMVSREGLTKGTAAEHLEPLVPDAVFVDATPMSRVLAALGRREYILVRTRQDANGIVTRADLNKPPVRVYMFGLVSLLEMHMTYWLRTCYPDEAWQHAIAPARVKKARELRAMRESRREDLELVDCIQFCDKRIAVLASTEILAKFGLSDQADARAKLTQAERLRDLLAHSQSDLDEGASWPAVVSLAEKTEFMLAGSDANIERLAARVRREARR